MEASEAKRIEFLFELYEKYTANLFAGVKKKMEEVKFTTFWVLKTRKVSYLKTRILLLPINFQSFLMHMLKHLINDIKEPALYLKNLSSANLLIISIISGT